MLEGLKRSGALGWLVFGAVVFGVVASVMVFGGGGS